MICVVACVVVCLFSSALLITASDDGDCEPLLSTVMTMRSALVNYSPQPQQAVMYRQFAIQQLHVDFMNDEQLTRVVCSLLKADSVSDVAQLLNIPYSMSKEYYDGITSSLATPQFQQGLQQVVQSTEASLEFLEQTGFPEFPLHSLTEEEVEEIVKTLFPSHGNVEEQEKIVDGLLHAQSIEEFCEMTGTEEKLDDYKNMPQFLQDAYNLYSAVLNLINVLKEEGLLSLPTGPESGPFQTPAPVISEECQELLNLITSIQQDAKELGGSNVPPLEVILESIEENSLDFLNELLCGIIVAQRNFIHGAPAAKYSHIAVDVHAPRASVDKLYHEGLQALYSAPVRRDIYRQKRFVDAARAFLSNTGFPHFPLAIEMTEARRHLGQTSGWALLLVMPGIVKSGDTVMYANAMVAAESVEEFAEMTGTEEDVELYGSEERILSSRARMYENILMFVDKATRACVFDVVDDE